MNQNAFVNSVDASVAVKSNKTRTVNGMRALTSSNNAPLDLFNEIGSSRGKNIVPQFINALNADEDLAVRIALWARDARQGSGERATFRSILRYLADADPLLCMRVLNRVPELGRWDDVLCVLDISPRVDDHVFGMIARALNSGEALCAKWMPRKGEVAIRLRRALKMSPKTYRKTLVNLTKVVETQMCAKDWENINFEHVPSVAATRYRKAFYRNAPYAYTKYVDGLNKGNAKINASVSFPHNIIMNINLASTIVEKDQIKAQWNSLPNLVGDKNILPVVDVSGSMCCFASGRVKCIDVAVSLGLYLSDKNKGAFHGMFCQFSEKSKLQLLKGDIFDQYRQLARAEWGLNTNLNKMIENILDHAVKNDVPAADMPDMVLILSDMQFDRCAVHDDSAIKMIARKYKEAGYEVPKIVFWNLKALYGNVAAKSTKNGVALVSGFSPNILKTLLSDNLEKFTPENVMLETVNVPRYNY